MKDNQTIIRYLKHENIIELSSIYTNLFSIITFLLPLFFSYKMIKDVFDGNTNEKEIIAACVMIGLLVACTFYVLNTVVAELEGQKIRIKYIFGKKIILNLDSIDVKYSTKIGRSHYTIIEYPDGDNSKKALITNSASVVLGNENSAGNVINIAQEYFEMDMNRDR